MDIFEIAQQGMQIQEDEIAAKKAAEEEAATKKKTFKFNVVAARDAAAKKDYSYYRKLSDDDKKTFSSHVLNMWMAQVWSGNTGGRALTTKDAQYARILIKTNEILNRNCYQDKALVWLLACTIQEFIVCKKTKSGQTVVTDYLPFSSYTWLKAPKREAEEKYSEKLIKYMADELYSSPDKIYDLIESGLITEEAMEAISADLDTLEKPSKTV